MAGDADYDIYLVLRHTRGDERSRLGSQEPDFEVSRLVPYLKENYFLCELPSMDQEEAREKYLTPVGPTGLERECGMISMFYGVFAAIAMMKSSLRHYTHVMKTRTDYLPWVAPWITGMLDLYEKSGRKIIVDGLVTQPRRYPDRPDIPWQGSISDMFSFSSLDKFLALWDIEDMLPKLWTGVAETTVFRAAMARFLGDDLQSPRRNETVLKKYFTWVQNDSKPSFNMLRGNVLSDEIKGRILECLEKGSSGPEPVNCLIRTTYDFLTKAADRRALELAAGKCFSSRGIKMYLDLCSATVLAANPV
jgi:hypothetical protein